MNSNYRGDFRPNRRRSTIQETGKKKKKKKLPAWKVLVTVFIIILSMSVVTVALGNMFGVLSLKDLLIKGGAAFEPKPEEHGGVIDPDTGMPVLSGERKAKVFNFLVVGLNDDTGNNTDTIMLAQFNVGARAVNIVQIPRDTYIHADYNFSKINSVFAANYNRADYGTSKEDRRKKGITAFTEFVETAYACKIDYYVLVDLNAFQSFIDDIGGLKVNVPCKMDYEDPEQNLYIHLKAGEQVLSGYDAMCLVRNRHTYVDADYGRMNVQKIFMSALLKQVKENLTDLSTLQGIVKVAFNNVLTNLTLDNCIYFATQMLDVDMSGMSMVTMPNEIVGSRLSTLELDAVDVVNRFLNVYETPVTPETFDVKNWLTNPGDKSLYTAYMTHRSEYEVYTADKVDSDSIHLNTFNN